MTQIVITQSNYIPWRGWYAMVRSAETLMYLDDVQYTRRDWRNRNLIAGPAAPQWITIPVLVAGKYLAKIHEIECANKTWWKSHLSSLDSAYKKCVGYAQIREGLYKEFEEAGELKFLSEINDHINRWLFSILDIRVNCLISRNYISSSERSQRLAELCMAAGADHYISGPAAKSYLDESFFDYSNIKVSWVNYELLPELPTDIRADRELSIIHLLATAGIEETTRLTTFNPAPLKIEKS